MCNCSFRVINNESAKKLLGDEILKKIAQEMTEIVKKYVYWLENERDCQS